MNLYIYNTLSEDPVIQSLLDWRQGGGLSRYYAACAGLLRAGAGLREYAAALLFGSAPPAFGAEGAEAYFNHDINEIYENIFSYDWDAECRKSGVLPLPDIARLSSADVTDYSAALNEARNAAGAGELGDVINRFFARYADAGEAQYAAFRWTDGGLAPAPEPDGITFDDLAALGYKKDVLIGNTRAFVSGRTANDVLLTGAAGTGKSSCVKAVFNMFRPCGLKLAELSKADIPAFPRLVEEIRRRKRRYIVYIDDLSFDGSDADYKTLKVALDGQIGMRPDNMLLYATSNRSRLVRETWKDREADTDIHANETLHEKTSLSERFGIRLYFPVLTQSEYFEIVALMLGKYGVVFNEEIGKKAVEWELENNGRSGRTAKQFVTDYLSRMRGINEKPFISGQQPFIGI